jgi:hypothetical protein
MAELAPERQVVKKALNFLEVDGWIFEEDAGAKPKTIQDTYQEELKGADLYLGIFWKGYGDYTIEEFEYAQKLKKPCLIYEKRTELEDRDPALQTFLNAISEVKTGLTINWFDTLEELEADVKRDVAGWQVEAIRKSDEKQKEISISKEKIQAVISVCYRQAVFTRYHAQYDPKAMIDSLAECRVEIQKLAVYVTPVESQRLVVGIMDDLRLIEKTEKEITYGYDEKARIIDKAKRRIINTLTDLAIFANLPLEFPQSVTEEIFWSLEEANSAPKGSEN